VTLTCRGQLPAGEEPEEAVVQRSSDFSIGGDYAEVPGVVGS
jgi:hypothetical protein